MNLSNRYSFTPNDQEYIFTTENGIIYKVFFDSSLQSMFSDFPNIQTEIIEFSFQPDNISLDQIRNFPPDKRIIPTVVFILNEFFSKNQKAILYTCEALDGKQKVRARLFNKIFNSIDNSKFVKFNSSFTDLEIDYYQSMLLRTDHPKVKEIEKAFFEISNDLNKG